MTRLFFKDKCTNTDQGEFENVLHHAFLKTRNLTKTQYTEMCQSVDQRLCLNLISKSTRLTVDNSNLENLKSNEDEHDDGDNGNQLNLSPPCNTAYATQSELILKCMDDSLDPDRFDLNKNDYKCCMIDMTKQCFKIIKVSKFFNLNSRTLYEYLISL